MLRLKKRFQLILISVVLFLVVGFFFHSAVSSRAQDPPGSELTYPGYVERSFPVPDRCLSPSGLAWDGEHLWLGDEGGWLFKVQSDDGVLIETFSPLGVVCSGMSWDEATDTLLFTDGTSPTVYRFHPAERTSEPIYTASGSPQIQGHRLLFIRCCVSYRPNKRKDSQSQHRDERRGSGYPWAWLGSEEPLLGWEICVGCG